MCFRLSAKYIYLRIVLTDEAVLILPLLAHPCTAVLLMYVLMCDKVGIIGVKSRICMSSAPSSRSFIFTSHVGLEEDTKSAWVLK